jgi:hypothetical protein
MSQTPDDGATPSSLGLVARYLLRRIQSDESLDQVAKAVSSSVDQLTATELSHLMTALRKRTRRELPTLDPPGDLPDPPGRPPST